MESLNVFASRLVTKREYFARGHRACQGCAEALAVRLVAKALGSNVVVASATGCMEIVSSPFPFTNWNVPWIHVAFENAAAVITGAESGVKALVRKGKLPDKGTVFLGMGGDGATSDIGLQALSGAFERGHKFVYVCYDNEAYMNTGIQRSSATPLGAATSTCPAGDQIPGKTQYHKDMTRIMAAHRIPYVAQASPSHWSDLIEKVQKALSKDGPSFINIISPCHRGWRYAMEDTIEMARLAVETCYWPLYECDEGTWRITYTPKEKLPLTEWTGKQGRFAHLKDRPDVLAQGQAEADRRWQELQALSGIGNLCKPPEKG